MNWSFERHGLPAQQGNDGSGRVCALSESHRTTLRGPRGEFLECIGALDSFVKAVRDDERQLVANRVERFVQRGTGESVARFIRAIKDEA